MVGLLSVLVVTYLIYMLGVSGPFIFDDFPNLSSLGSHGGVRDRDTFLDFVFGRGGWLGRPLSMLSFLIDGQTWPTDPAPFKRTNILLHLLNGVLVLALTRQIAVRFIGQQNSHKIEYIALAACALWLLHPIHISASMQVVQRMTLLMSAFTLGGLILYVYGRMLLERTESGLGYLWMSAGIGLFGILATLSKENGILIVLYVLVIEFTAFRGARIHATIGWRLWIGLFCVLPLVGLGAYIGYSWDGMLQTYEQRRHFGPVERLLTQAPILLEYLYGMLVPRASHLGLFHDDYDVSTSLIAPWYTLPTVIIVLGAAVAALVFARRIPLLSYAVLWFFAGHILESTVIPLELYYEHRNYLPMLGIVIALSCSVALVGREMRRLAILGMGAFLLMEAVVGLQTTYTWGKPGVMATVWARENPESSRAQQYAAQYWAGQGALRRALSRIDQGIKHNPEMASLRLQRMMFICYLNEKQALINVSTLYALREARYDTAVFGALKNLQEAAEAERCSGISFEALDAVIEALKWNPNYSRNKLGMQKLLYRQAQLRRAQRDLDGAMRYLEQAYKMRAERNIRIEQVMLLASAGLHCEAAWFVDKALATKTEGFKKYQLTEVELRELRVYLEGAAEGSCSNQRGGIE